MKFLYANVLYDYNDRSRGWGLDQYTMIPALKKMLGKDLIVFDCSDFGDMSLKKSNNIRLIELINQQRPDIMFHSMFTDQLTKETLKYIKDSTKTTTLNWFSDDWWHFDSLTKEWCWYFDYSITMDRDSIKKYHDIGYKNVILSQWAAQPETYPKLDLPFKYDVSFVGQPHGERRELMDELNKSGIKVSCFGYGWKETPFKRRWNKRFERFPLIQFDKGKISHEEMIKVFNRSRINLNLSASSNEDKTPQMKARNFEVPCCGGFLLTGNIPHLEDYYEIDKEVVCFNDTKDMIDKIKYYLEHDNERIKIAQAGYERTIKDHTYEKRFKDILSQVRLKTR